MLKHLLIKNYALIQHLELNPDPTLNIITGETGAGKSIILGAIGLLLGNRVDTKTLYNPDEKCLIEGQFDLAKMDLKETFETEELDYEPVCIIRREISPLGKSRAFINDTPVNLEILKKIGERLLDVHSQHDTIALASNEYQIQIVDAYAQNSKLLLQFQSDYSDYFKEKANLEKVKKIAEKYQKDFDFNRYRHDELRKAKLIPGQLEQLEQELVVLENAEAVKTKLFLVTQYLYEADNSSIDYLEEAHANMSSLSGFSANYASLKDRLQTVIIELKDVFREVELAIKNVEFDQDTISGVQMRIDLIYSLLKKHQVRTETELLAIEKDLYNKIDAVFNIDEDIEDAQKRFETALKKMQKSALELSNSRKKVFVEIENKITGLLKDLGMPNAAIKIDYKEDKVTNMGVDLVNFLFSANKGIAPQQLKFVASGGEFSRLMLAIKYILANKKALPTIIFDEIDTGVSGEISIKVGKMMKEMAQNHQIIAISHLHQIAAQGNAHYFVYKDNSAKKAASKIKLLTHNERILEIAEMIGGANPSAGILENAKHIIESYQ